MFSDVWQGLDKMHQEDPQGYSRIMEESVNWQKNATSVPEPCKVSIGNINSNPAVHVRLKQNASYV